LALLIFVGLFLSSRIFSTQSSARSDALALVDLDLKSLKNDAEQGSASFDAKKEVTDRPQQSSYSSRAKDAPQHMIRDPPVADKHVTEVELKADVTPPASDKHATEAEMKAVVTSEASKEPGQHIENGHANRQHTGPDPLDTIELDTELYQQVQASSSHTNFQMAVHRGPPEDVVSGQIKAHGAWEPEMCGVLSVMFEEADKLGLPSKGTPVFLDVGANIGFHTLCVSSGNRHTISIEAAPVNYNALKTSIGLNPGWSSRMSVLEVGVSDGKSQEPLCFRNDPENYGGNSAVDPSRHPQPGWLDPNSHPCLYVPVSTVDAELKKVNQEAKHGTICPLVMKMDVEGFEHLALSGAEELLSKYTPCKLMMEFHTVLLRTAGAASPLDTIRLLQHHGYNIVSHSENEIEMAAGGDAQLDLEWEHSSMHTADSPDSCYQKCMPPP